MGSENNRNMLKQGDMVSLEDFEGISTRAPRGMGWDEKFVVPSHGIVLKKAFVQWDRMGQQIFCPIPFHEFAKYRFKSKLFA